MSGNVKIVEANGERWAIESRFLEPVVHSVMHIDQFDVRPENCEHLVLMVGSPLDELADTYVEAYIRRGEELGVPKRPTVAQRSATRPWYDLTNETARGEALWVKERQYRFVAPVNPRRFPANCRLYTIVSKTSIDPSIVGGVLNSSIVTLSTLLFGRPVGVEANWSTMVSDTALMLVPDWNTGDATTTRRVATAFEKLSGETYTGISLGTSATAHGLTSERHG